jgi:hypothetical protein
MYFLFSPFSCNVAEFVFPRPVNVKEDYECSDLYDRLCHNIELARNLPHAYVLPQLEHRKCLQVSGSSVDMSTVRLKVGPAEDIDSDDEDDDETEEALKKHTLLTIFYVSHPNPEDEIKKKANELINAENASALGGGGGGGGGSGAPTAVSGRAFSSPGTESNKSFGSDEPMFGAAAGKAAAATTGAGASAEDFMSLEDTAEILEHKLVTEELINVLQKNLGENPQFEIILIGQMMYFFHSMKYYFSLNLQHSGDKMSFRQARVTEKLAVQELKRKIIREREKDSVFFLDSSDDEGTDHEEEHDEGFGASKAAGELARAFSSATIETPEEVTAPVMLSPHMKLLSGSSFLASSASASASGSTPSYASPLRPQPPQSSKAFGGGGGAGIGGGGRAGMAMSSATHSGKKKGNGIKTIDFNAPPAGSLYFSGKYQNGADHASAAAADHLKTIVHNGRVLPESKAPPNYAVTSWSIQLISHDG